MVSIKIENGDGVGGADSDDDVKCGDDHPLLHFDDHQ